MKTTETAFGMPAPEKCLWAALVFCTFYQSYRYPLQINTASMSPTYSDTPAVFQAAKSVVTAAFCLISLFYLPRQKFSLPKWVMAVMVAFMSSYPLIKIVGAEAGDFNIYLDAAFWPLAALILVLPLTASLQPVLTDSFDSSSSARW